MDEARKTHSRPGPQIGPQILKFASFLPRCGPARMLDAILGNTGGNFTCHLLIRRRRAQNDEPGPTHC
jgi:hypothetical protein